MNEDERVVARSCAQLHAAAHLSTFDICLVNYDGIHQLSVMFCNFGGVCCLIGIYTRIKVCIIYLNEGRFYNRVECEKGGQ